MRSAARCWRIFLVVAGERGARRPDARTWNRPAEDNRTGREAVALVLVDVLRGAWTVREVFRTNGRVQESSPRRSRRGNTANYNLKALLALREWRRSAPPAAIVLRTRRKAAQAAVGGRLETRRRRLTTSGDADGTPPTRSFEVIKRAGGDYYWVRRSRASRSVDIPPRGTAGADLVFRKADLGGSRTGRRGQVTIPCDLSSGRRTARRPRMEWRPRPHHREWLEIEGGPRTRGLGTAALSGRWRRAVPIRPAFRSPGLRQFRGARQLSTRASIGGERPGCEPSTG